MKHLKNMAKISADEKRIFVVASSDQTRLDYFADFITKSINNSLVFTALDGFEALFKMENAPPHVLLIDVNLSKLTELELATKVLHHPKLNETSVIIVSPLPDKEHFVDQVVTGQVQFLVDLEKESLIISCLTKALNRLVDNRDFSYRLKFLAPNEVLFKEGDDALSVFIVKRGQLQAFKGNLEDRKVLGTIAMGEFVGEMAHINSEPRSATVEAISNCELIEIPMGTLDIVLFSKPAWSKALVSTLSKRLKRTIENL